MRIPEHIRLIAPYVPGKPIEEAERQMAIREVVKLASNENPLGPSPLALQAVREAAMRVHRYPDSAGYKLRRALSESLGFAPEQIVLGNGSTEIVEILAKTFLSQRRGAVIADPSFVMYPIAVKAMAAPLTLVPLRDYRHDLVAMAKACDAATALVYIANPNNPTGTYVGRAAFDAYFEAVPGHVLTVVDEAYRDYVAVDDYPDCLDDLRAGRNVVVLRTFSKIHGLAGMRIGYAIATREVAAALETVRSPFNTSVLAQVAALAALSDVDHLSRSRVENKREVAYLEQELARRGVRFVPTVANFLLVFTPGMGAKAFDSLLREGVIVRPLGSHGLARAVRVSVGTRAENERFLAAWDQSVARSRGRARRASSAS